MKRIIRIGNTEEHYTFRPEEILYAETIKGEERTSVHLLNQTIYTLPCGLSVFAKTIDDSMIRMHTMERSYWRDRSQAIDNSMRSTLRTSIVRLGRSYLANYEYIVKAQDGIVDLCAEVEDKTIEDRIIISRKACSILSDMIGKKIHQLERFQHDNHSNGYTEVYSGGSGGYTGFMSREYKPTKRDDTYYDIEDDDILFLGM